MEEKENTKRKVAKAPVKCPKCGEPLNAVHERETVQKPVRGVYVDTIRVEPIFTLEQAGTFGSVPTPAPA